jgi:hypothetical protein
MATKHTHAVVFGRKVDGCPRCAELLAGAEPVRGWGSQWSYKAGRYITKAEQLQERLAEIRNHDCKVSRCAIVCTAFDW